MAEEWSMDRVAEQYRRDVRRAFESENATWLAEERAGIADVKATCDAIGCPYPDWLGERDSFYWEIFTRAEIRIAINSVQVILPDGFAIYPDFVSMFGGTSVGWTTPSVAAVMIDGEARVAIELILIDYWDDERHAEWLAEKAKRT
jgi:hypothetical protein